MKIFRINPEFRVLRLTFHRKSALKCLIRQMIITSFISTPEPKAHGLANSIPDSPSSVVRRPSTISNIFSSETTGPIKFKLHMETP